MSVNFGLKQIVDWFQPRLTKAFSDTLAKWAFALFLLLLAWTLGRFVWSFIGVPIISVTSHTSEKPNIVTTSSASAYELEQLINLNLFGLYNATVPLVESIIDAPRTNLNLTLVGLVANSAPTKGLAVIANSGSQNIYGVDETIKGTGVVLRQVLNDRVILRNNGRDEALMLQGVDYSQRAQSVSNNKPSDQKDVSSKISSQTDLSAVKAEIIKRPQALLKYITLSQERENNKVIGYRLGPGGDSRLFNESGLKSGDVATAINGVDLTNPSQMNKIWRSLSDASEIVLTVRRSGQLHQVTIDL